MISKENHLYIQEVEIKHILENSKNMIEVSFFISSIQERIMIL